MKETTLANLILGRENFKQRYRTLKNLRVFSASSVADFLENKIDLDTPLSNLIFLSNPEWNSIAFHEVRLDKISDNIYEIGVEEKGYLGKVYKLYDKTGYFPCFWPTKDSKIPSIISCDRFEHLRKFRDGLIKTALINYNKNSGDLYLYHIDFDMKEGDKNENLVFLRLGYV